MFDDLPCPDCRGRESDPPCARCGGRNAYVVEGCPAAHVDAQSLEALRLKRWADRGFLPRSGGTDAQRRRDMNLIDLAYVEASNAAATDGR